MPSIPFTKYHGAGNDFIMIDDRNGLYEPLLSAQTIAEACHRRFGIGADGMILLQSGRDGADFFMRYFNSDGRPSSFCGNGGRCIVAFAAKLGLHSGKTHFLGTDGPHSGELHADGQVSISMRDVERIHGIADGALALDTGSPHYVTFVDDLEAVDVPKSGSAIRYSPDFTPDGINVNFVQHTGTGTIAVRTYERGVEDETWACGTGVVASAIAACYRFHEDLPAWTVHTRGGELKAQFRRAGPEHFTDVVLRGGAVAVFEGRFDVPPL